MHMRSIYGKYPTCEQCYDRMEFIWWDRRAFTL